MFEYLCRTAASSRAAFATVVTFALFLTSATHAQLIDDIDVRAVGNVAEASLKLNAQVRFVRSVSAANGKVLEIFFQISQGEDGLAGVVEESRKSPPNAPVVPFVVSYSQVNVAASRRIVIEFERPVKATARLGLNGRGFIVNMPIVRSPAERTSTAATPQQTTPNAPPPAPAPAAPPVQPSSTAELPTASADARATFERAKAALAKNDFETALAQFNLVLNLPPNDLSQEAQELVGGAREGLGETRKARAEYELYLKLYPAGPGADRVRTKLQALSSERTGTTASSSGTSTANIKRPLTRTIWGSVSQSYYGGQSRIDTSNIIVTPATNATTIDQQTLTSTDQSSLVTNLDGNVRWRDNVWDTRMVARDTYTLSFLKDAVSRNRLSALYVDFRNAPDRYGARIGRQSPSGGGVLYRFDGVSANYGFTPIWKGGVVIGTPAEKTLGERKTFYGVSLDAEGLIPNLGAGAYLIEQRTAGFVDRRAAGAELRYNTEQVNLLGSLDYDIAFKRLNIGSIQATWNIPETVSFNALYDYRASPPLQLSNSLLGLGVFSLRDAVALIGRSTAEKYADLLTPTSRVALVGFTVPINKTWQAGLDYRISSVTGTGATPSFPASPGSGNVKTASGQVIGTGIFGSSDVIVLNASYLDAPSYNGYLVAVNPRFAIGTNWTVEPIVRWYRQADKGSARAGALESNPANIISLVGQNFVRCRSELGIESIHFTAR